MALAPVVMFVCCIGISLQLFLFVEDPLHRYARRAFN